MLSLLLEHGLPRLDVALPQIQTPLLLCLICPVLLRHEIGYFGVLLAWLKDCPLGNGDYLGRIAISLCLFSVDNFDPLNAWMEIAEMSVNNG